MSDKRELDEFQFSADDCARWVHKLNVMTDKFMDRDDVENAKLMHVCSVLMAKLAFDVQCSTMGGPFPVKGGDC